MNNNECSVENCPNFWEKCFEIGKGGNGIIYSSEDCPNTALKLSNKTYCNMFKEQYENQLLIYTCFNSIKLDKNFYKRVCILKPENFYTYKSNNCSFRMKRIFPLAEISKTSLIQTYLGEDDFEMDVKGRGLYLGLNQLKEVLKLYTNADNHIVSIDDKINTLISDLGTSMAIINLVCGLTNLDVEIVLGKPSELTNTYKLYIIDFDQVSRHNFEINKDLIWGYEAEPYYPLNSNIFWESYFKIAEMIGKMDFAKSLKERLTS